MIKKIFEKNKGGKIASLSQIIILVLGIVAISYALGSEIGEVSSLTPTELAASGIEVSVSSAPSVASTAITQLPIPAAVSESQQIASEIFNAFISKTASSTTSVSGQLATAAEQAAAKIAAEQVASGQAWAAGTGIVNGVLNVLANAGIATILAFTTYGILSALNVNQEALLHTAIGVGAGWFVGSTVGSIIAGFGGFAFISGPALIGGLVGAAVVGGVIFLATFRSSEKENIIFSCNPWQPPAKGEDCRQCGKGILACTKYQCQSLGAGCKLINEGTSDEKCDWVNPNNIDPPIITTWNETLQNNYAYTPDHAVFPPDRGVILKYKNGALPAYKAITLGIHLQDVNGKEQLGMCRASTTRKNSFSDMEIPISNLEYLENHSIAMSFPSVINPAAVNTLQEGENRLYIRCNSTNGVANRADFVIKFNIESGPDTNPPEVFITNPLNNMPILHGTRTTEASFYVTEPSDCKWSHSDQGYDSMENLMTCEHDKLHPTYFGGQITYLCTTTLTGLVDSENKIYTLCKDQPVGVAENLRNVMPQSYVYTLTGTQPLTISSAGPLLTSFSGTSGTIKGAGDSIKVTLTAETTAGFNAGAASCYYNEKCYSSNGNAEHYTLFSYPAGTQLFSQFHHSQELYLPAGSYDCSIKCCDLGGNCDTKTTSYTVETDSTEPFVARAYYDDPNLKIITNEPSECVYGTTDCIYTFADGLKMTDSSDGLSHSIDWNARSTFYIKCKDNYGNQPNANTGSGCSIIVRPVGLLS